MSFQRWNKEEFNGYLNSLRYICDKFGMAFFALDNECKLNRVETLYNTTLHGSNYVASLLWADDFETKLSELIETNKLVHHRKQKFEENRAVLLKLQQKARRDYCGLGTKKVKLILNKEAEFDLKARILRLLLEIEDVNITAKNSYGDYADYRYYEKENLIQELIDLFDSKNLTYGFKQSDIPTRQSIVFFELDGKQFSWHSDLNFNENKTYKKDWDKQENSHLSKIEQLVLNEYQDEISQSQRLKF